MYDADPDYEAFKLVPLEEDVHQKQPISPFMGEDNLYQEIADMPPASPTQADETSLSKLEPAQIEKLVEMYYTLLEKVGHKKQPKPTETTEQGCADDTQPSPEPLRYENLYEEVENEQDRRKPYTSTTTLEAKRPVPKPREKGLQEGISPGDPYLKKQLSKAQKTDIPTTRVESLKKLGTLLIVRSLGDLLMTQITLYFQVNSAK